MNPYPIYIGKEALQPLQNLTGYSQILVLQDENTRECCYPLIKNLLPPHTFQTIPPGEIYKQLNTCSLIWKQLSEENFDRKSLLINLGGGVIGDLGGFVAATYKRGIDFMQVPTTLLSQVDASVGGKLGIDFLSFKNQLGVFKEPVAVCVYPDFLRTLPYRELRSGYAEVIKHHLIADAAAWENLIHTKDLEYLDWEVLIRHSIAIKSEIVAQDPYEKGPRKALNFGHTLGHAVESYFLESPLPLLHGEAIAIGMIMEAYLSQCKGYLSESQLVSVSNYISRIYPKTKIPSEAAERLYRLCLQDKKNQNGVVLCTFLQGIGSYLINCPIVLEDVKISLAFYNEYAS